MGHWLTPWILRADYELNRFSTAGGLVPQPMQLFEGQLCINICATPAIDFLCYLKQFYLFILKKLFLAALGLHCQAWVFFGCSE